MLRTPEEDISSRVNERREGGEKVAPGGVVKGGEILEQFHRRGGVMQADLAPFLFMGLHRAVFTLVGIEAGSSIFRRRK